MGRYYWYVKIPQFGYMGHRLKDIAFYVQKRTAHWAVCYNFPLFATNHSGHPYSLLSFVNYKIMHTFHVRQYLTWRCYIYCPACRTTLIATRFWVVMICPIIKCLTVLEFSFILFDLCLFITIFNFILNYVPIVTFWIFTYHKILILLIIFCFIWSYWIIYFLTCLEVFWSVVS